jgi:hypothetical protein
MIDETAGNTFRRKQNSQRRKRTTGSQAFVTTFVAVFGLALSATLESWELYGCPRYAPSKQVPESSLFHSTAPSIEGGDSWKTHWIADLETVQGAATEFLVSVLLTRFQGGFVKH